MSIITRGPDDIMTRIEDVIVPEVFLPYIIQRTAELSEIYQSGIIRHDNHLDILASRGGEVVQMPFWNDLEGEEELLRDDPDFIISLGRITTNQENAVLMERVKGWASTDLSGALAGDDPLRAIGDLVATYWMRRFQLTLLALLKGVFLSDGMEHATLDISANIQQKAANDPDFDENAEKDADKKPPSKPHKKTSTKAANAPIYGKAANAAAFDVNKINAHALIDTFQKLGDAQHKITAMVVHSAVYAQMQKLNLIDPIPDSRGEIEFSTYLRRRIIIDDGCPREDIGDGEYKYTTYLFGQGAIAQGNGQPKVPFETGREKRESGGYDYLIHRYHFLLHPRGLTWKGNANPTNNDLSNGNNWSRVIDLKNVPMVQLISNG